MTAILVYSEQQDTARELIAAARELGPQLGLTVCAAVLGAEASDAAAAADVDGATTGAGSSAAPVSPAVAASALAAHGAEQVYVCDDPALVGLDTAVVAQTLAHIVEQAGASVVLLGSTRRGRELGGRLAQRLGAGCVTDATLLAVEDGRLVAGRYNLGGATVQREAIDTPVQVIAVMPKIFEAGEPAGAAAGAVTQVSPELAAPAVRLVARRPKGGEAVDLAAAPRIVGVGRGLAKREDVTIGEGLAAALGAELACTKSLADFGWLPEDRIVGLSGAKTAPDVYLAVGISGQVQHTVGIAQARIIAVVNQDKDAPIFGLADYGVVGDLYKVVPALVEKLKAL